MTVSAARLSDLDSCLDFVVLAVDQLSERLEFRSRLPVLIRLSVRPLGVIRNVAKLARMLPRVMLKPAVRLLPRVAEAHEA